jgi:hypothetical protein
MTSITGVGALCQPERLLDREPCRGSHPVVGGIVRASCRSICRSISRWWVSYLLPPSCGIVLVVWYGAGLASNQTEVTAVTLVFAGSVRRSCLCQIGHVAWGSTSPCLEKY